MRPQTERLIQEAFDLLGVNNFASLSRAYSEEDQKLMKNWMWDHQSPTLITNRMRKILEKINPADLSEDDSIWWHEILWFWYHHAISCAVLKRKDRALAQQYAARAIELQPDDHPNQITELLFLLVHDRLQEAKEMAEHMPTPEEDPEVGIERQSALDLVALYERGEFFA